MIAVDSMMIVDAFAAAAVVVVEGVEVVERRGSVLVFAVVVVADSLLPDSTAY